MNNLAIWDRPAILKLFTRAHVVFTSRSHDLGLDLDLCRDSVNN